jgi:hypothetical protein
MIGQKLVLMMLMRVNRILYIPTAVVDLAHCFLSHAPSFYELHLSSIKISIMYYSTHARR